MFLVENLCNLPETSLPKREDGTQELPKQAAIVIYVRCNVECELISRETLVQCMPSRVTSSVL